MLDVERGNAPFVFHALIDGDAILIARQHFAHRAHGELRATGGSQFLLQSLTVEREISRAGRPAAAEIVCVAAKEPFLPRIQIAEARNISAAAHQSAPGLPAARFGNNAGHYILDVEL